MFISMVICSDELARFVRLLADQREGDEIETIMEKLCQEAIAR